MAWDWLDSIRPVDNYCFDVPLTTEVFGADSESFSPAQAMQMESFSGLDGFDGELLIAGKKYDASANEPD